jgi:hypothetical protein
MKLKRNWIMGMVAAAAAVLTVVSVVNAPVVDETPTEALPEGNCAYTWATKDAPELTEFFDAAIKELNPEAIGHAQYFGEDCRRSDDSVTFGAMETDFYVRLPVEDLSQKEAFGNWAAQVMEVVTQIPREQLRGPNLGFVEFVFEKNEDERLVLRIPIQRYLDESPGKTGADLFDLFYSPP